VLQILLLLFVAPCPLALAADSVQPKNVLILYSFSPSQTLDSLQALETAIRSRASTPVNFHVQYLESQRFGTPSFEQGLSETLREAYAQPKLDLVIAVAYPALRFAAEFRDRTFPSIPIVFMQVAPARLKGQKLWPGVTGITFPADVQGTVDLALGLNPDASNAAVVAGDSEFERYWLGATVAELQRHSDRLNVIELVGLPTDQLLQKISALPAHTIVFFGVIPQDSAHLAIGTYDVLGAIAQRLPTYCVHDYCLDHGAIGGSYPDSNDQAVRGGELAARVLSGEKADDLPVIHGVKVGPKVDWRQLRRWNIPVSALPAGTLILYRQTTVWEQYQRYILAGVVLIFVQGLLIASLIWQRARRRSTTQALQQLGGRLIHAQEEERARIARELHDDFSQRLAVQCIELVQLGKILPASEVEARAEALKILKGTKEISADMRALSHELHCSRLELVGLEPALSGLCEEISKQCNIEVRFTEPECSLNLPKSVALCLFRIAQEALGNVVKHSHASSAQVELSADGHGVRLRISDTGNGFNHDPKKPGEGIGLISMRERLRLVGGRLSVSSVSMQGAEIVAEIPLWIPATEDQVTATHAVMEVES
jgi:signal transduction histidine kinase/ABC-type uncharacterized transport system substrate-binding protein